MYWKNLCVIVIKFNLSDLMAGILKTLNLYRKKFLPSIIFVTALVSGIWYDTQRSNRYTEQLKLEVGEIQRKAEAQQENQHLINK